MGKSEWQELKATSHLTTTIRNKGEEGLCFMGPFPYLHNAGSQAGIVSPKVGAHSGMPRNPFIHVLISVKLITVTTSQSM